MATHTLDFERPLLELERQIEELKRVASETAVDVTKELAPLEKRLAELRAEIYRNLTPMQRVQVARHPRRPYTLDYLSTVFTDFVELHGDRLFRDDPAIVGGWARHEGEPAAELRHGAPRRLPQGAPPHASGRAVPRPRDHAGGHTGRLPRTG